jgi:MFS family permease
LHADSTKVLAVTVIIFFFTSSLSSTFLPIYLKDSGLSLPEIIVVMLFTFIVIGLLPPALLKVTKHFERILSFGVFSTALFYLALIYVKNPILLGLAYGLSIATFWPSFNLLLFRLSDVDKRATIISLFSVTIPSITGVVSPAVGGFLIETFGFTALFASSILLYLAAFIFSLGIRYQPEAQKLSIPRNPMFAVFLLTFVLFGMSESYWIVYPFFVYSVSTTFLSMGLVVAASSLVISIITVVICRVSDVKRKRVEFAVVSSILYACWYFALTQVSNTAEIVVLSLLSGFAGAFALSWYAYYGDSFERKYHASILVMMEVALMAGRIMNLAPTYLYITTYDYAPYFIVLSLVSLLLIPLFIKSKSYT